MPLHSGEISFRPFSRTTVGLPVPVQVRCRRCPPTSYSAPVISKRPWSWASVTVSTAPPTAVTATRPMTGYSSQPGPAGRGAAGGAHHPDGQDERGRRPHPAGRGEGAVAGGDGEQGDSGDGHDGGRDGGPALRLAGPPGREHREQRPAGGQADQAGAGDDGLGGAGEHDQDEKEGVDQAAEHGAGDHDGERDPAAGGRRGVCGDVAGAVVGRGGGGGRHVGLASGEVVRSSGAVVLVQRGRDGRGSPRPNDRVPAAPATCRARAAARRGRKTRAAGLCGPRGLGVGECAVTGSRSLRS